MKRKMVVFWVALLAGNISYLKASQSTYIDSSVFCTYSSPIPAGHMCFDNEGNLYIIHYDNGHFLKYSSTGQATTLTSIPGNPSRITYSNSSGYGNNLLISVRNGANHSVMKSTTNGDLSSFAPAPYGVTFVAIDTTGNYGNLLYTSGSAQDHLYKIDSSGSLSMFTLWPNWIDGGGVYDMAFDNSGLYGNKMFVASSFVESQASYSGIFSIDPDGTVTRFGDMVSAYAVGFDPAGTYFDNDMFVMGRTSYSDASNLWRIHADGTSEKVMEDIKGFAFSPEGELFVSSYDYPNDIVTITRVIPEPATLAILALGGACMHAIRRKHKA